MSCLLQWYIPLETVIEPKNDVPEQHLAETAEPQPQKPKPRRSKPTRSKETATTAQVEPAPSPQPTTREENKKNYKGIPINLL